MSLAGWQAEPEVGPFPSNDLHMLVLHVADAGELDARIEAVSGLVKAAFGKEEGAVKKGKLKLALGVETTLIAPSFFSTVPST
ncbi:MAG: hypothetical protein RIR68_463 [Pseudomonadota bacterium]